MSCIRNMLLQGNFHGSLLSGCTFLGGVNDSSLKVFSCVSRVWRLNLAYDPGSMAALKGQVTDWPLTPALSKRHVDS